MNSGNREKIEELQQMDEDNAKRADQLTALSAVPLERKVIPLSRLRTKGKAKAANEEKKDN